MKATLESLRLAWPVAIRNWTVFRKDFLANISPTLADPALMMTALGMGLSPFIGKIEGLTYAEYLAPGMIATTALFTAFFECSYGFYVRMSFENIFKAMLTTPIGVAEIVLGEFLWLFIRVALMSACVAVVLAAMGMVHNLWLLPLFPIVSGLLALPCGAIGLLASSQVANINQFQTVYSFLIAPIFYLSGVFFPLADRPWLDAVVQFSPFHHGVRLLQITAWGTWLPGEILYHVAALLGFTALLGWLAYRRIRLRLIS